MKRTRALVCVTTLTGSLCAIGVPALGDAVRTDTKLGGFSVSVNAAPFKVLIDDPSNPLPRPEDEAIAEADPSYTLAEVATGPAAHGLSSSLWPGNLLGNGLAAATENQAPNYPVKADARYPDKPFVADDPTGGPGMHATASGLEAFASAADGPQQIKGSVDLGAASSTSSALVDAKDVAIGRSTSRVSDVTLLGLIKIGSVATVVETRSDGKKQSSTGTTTVSGFSFAGQEYVVDEQGAHPKGGSGTPPVPLDALSPLQMAGITVSGIAQTSSSTADGVKRDAKGLRITVDTTMYRKALSDNTPGPVTDAAYQLFAAIPLPAQAATYRSFLYYTLSATPKISFVLGAGSAAAVANLPLSFEVPTFSPPAFGGPPSGGAIFPPSAPAVTGETTLPPALGSSDPVAVAPLVPGAPVTTTPELAVTAGTDDSEPFTGVGGLLVFGALLGAGLGGFGLLRLRGLFLAGAPLLGGCALGAPSTVPDLRGATA